MSSTRLRLLGVLGVTLLLCGVAAPRPARGDVLPLDAIGRLLVDGTRICTAFVIRSQERRVSEPYFGVSRFQENWIVSAGHCFGQHLTFVLGRTSYRILQVIGYSGGTVGHDVMVASFTTSAPLPALEPAFGEYPQPGDPLLLIGYTRGALMMRVSRLAGYDARGHMLIDGYASPGSSGGPVLIPGTRRVVGIGIETTIEQPAGTGPLHCMLKGCPVKPPYTASHIDRIKGVSRF